LKLDVGRKRITSKKRSAHFKKKQSNSRGYKDGPKARRNAFWDGEAGGGERGGIDEEGE